MRNPLIILGLLLVGGVVAAVALLGGGDEEASPQALEGPQGGAIEAPSAARSSSSGVRTVAQQSLNLNGLSELTVEVYDPAGKPLYEALVTPTVPDPKSGQTLPIPKLQPARWRSIEPGLAQVTVECPNFLPHTEEFELVGDEQQQLRIVLTPHGRLTGTVSSPLGEPMGAEIWILENGQDHPETPMEARDLDPIRTDRYGRFEVRFPEKRSFRVSVGHVGKRRVGTPTPVTMGPGEERTLDIIISDACRVQVEVSGLPPGEDGARSQVVAVIERMEGRQADENARGKRHRGDEGRENEGRENRKRNIVHPEGFERTGPWWRPVASRQLDESGKASFVIDRPGPEHRLVLTQMGARHVSSSSFGLRRGRPVSVRTSLPFILDEPIQTQKQQRSAPQVGLSINGSSRTHRPQTSAPAQQAPKRSSVDIPPLAIAVAPLSYDGQVRNEGFYWDVAKEER